MEPDVEAARVKALLFWSRLGRAVRASFTAWSLQWRVGLTEHMATQALAVAISLFDYQASISPLLDIALQFLVLELTLSPCTFLMGQ